MAFASKESEERYKLTQKTRNTILKHKEAANSSFFYIGKELKEIRDKKLYIKRKKTKRSFEYYVNKNFNLSLRKALFLIKIYEVFILKYKYTPEELSDIKWTSLRSILPVITDSNYKNMIEMVRVLKKTQAEERIKQLKEGITSMEEFGNHTHEWKLISYYRCSGCGKKSFVKPTDGIIIN
jgi:hypothetical protein